MKRSYLGTLFFSLAYFLGTCVVIYFNPRLDWKSVFWLLAVVLILAILQVLLKRWEEARTQEAIAGLSALLQSVEKHEECLPLKDDFFGTLRDDIYKTLLEQRIARDEAISARKQLKRNMEDVTHQIKTPLTGVLLLLELLESDPANAKEYQSRIRKEVERLYDLSDLLLKLSSLDAGAVTFEKVPFSAMGVLIDAELSLEPIMAKKKVSIELMGDDFILRGDRVWLLEALLNIMKNAAEVSPTGGKVCVSLKQNAVFKSILVKDNGPGLDPEQQKRVFERFYKSNPRSQGFGIGLSLAQTIVKMHDGELLLRSSSIGTEMELRFYP